MAAKSTKLSDLQPDRQNANQGTERGRTIIRDSLAKYGAGRSVLVDKDNELIAGNKTTEEALKAGFEAVIVDILPNQILVARRPDLDLDSETDTRARELAYADNFAGFADLAWNAEQVRLDAQQLDLSGFWNKAEFEKLFATFQPALQLQPGQAVAAQPAEDEDEAEAAGEDEDDSGYEAPAAANSDYPRMIQLFLSGAQFAAFNEHVEMLKEMHGFNNHTDAVLHAVALASAQ